MRTSPVLKSVQLERLGFDPAIFGRSWVTTQDLPAGHSLTRSDLAFKKPGGGLGYEALPRLLGQVLAHALPKDHLMELNDVRCP